MPQRRSHFPGTSSNTTPLQQKRALSPPPSNSTAGSRRSKRIKSSPNGSTVKTTPKKSPYFEHSSSSEAESEDDDASNFDADDASSAAESTPPSDDDKDQSDSSVADTSEDEKPKNKRGPKSAAKAKKGGALASGTKSTIAIHSGKQGTELWRPGVKVSGEGEVFIALPKAKSAGSTPYEPTTIHPNTIDFLKDLAKNNDRDWLKTHDADYRQSWRDWTSFVDSLTDKIIDKDETIPELPNKDLVFRIYRDIRFSPDPTPYKTHYSAAWSRTGRKGPYAAYYVQIQPKGSFIGAGVWHPEAAPLAKLRHAVDRRGQGLKNVLDGQGIRSTFLGGAKAGKDAIKKFTELNASNALKTKPRDYPAEHPDIAILRLRNYTIGKKLKDEEVMGEGALDRIADLIGTLTPFVTYLNNVVMPDEEPSSSSEDEDEEPGEGEEEDSDPGDDDEVDSADEPS